MKVTFFAAKKADAVLIQTDAGAVMIDTGLAENAAELVRELKERNITRLDALILSHYDKDHIGGTARILRKFPVERIYGTYRDKKDDLRQLDKAVSRHNVPFIISNRDITFSLDGAVYDIYPASAEYRTSFSNNASLIVSVTFKNVSFLFTGDAEDERIREFVEENYVKSDVLKMPYHGYPLASLGLLLKAAEPSLCVITNSRRLPPAQKLKQTKLMIMEAGAEYLETAYGTITIVTDGRSCDVIR